MSQRTVLITGCSEGGIGAALAAEFHRRGCRVFATARNVDKMQSLRALGIEAVAMDVTSDASIAKAVAEVEGRSVSDVAREAIAALVEQRRTDKRFGRLLDQSLERHAQTLSRLREDD